MSEPTILCVDDEAGVLSSLRRLLRKEGYKILTANSGDEGLALMDKQKVHVVISDQRMPEMTGTEFLQEVKGRFPQVVRVILSGYAEIHAIVDSINKAEVYRFLPKPWDDDELKQTIKHCLTHYAWLNGKRSGGSSNEEQHSIGSGEVSG